MSKKDSQPTGLEIAVIGMTGRYPGAKNLDEYWNVLINGVEAISFFTREELEESCLQPEELNHPSYVGAKGVLEDIEYFDTAFFGYTPREAEIMTPQMRVFHECSWTALEDAGYNPDSYNGLIGVFAGAAQDVYWEFLTLLSGNYQEFGVFETSLLSSKDPLGTRLSYKLNLTGPSFTLYTACSTSGVAVHEACQALLGGECHMALAGAISIWFPQKSGYLHQTGMITSPDGHCRTFDTGSCGAVFGDGVGVFLLKLLEDALHDGDHIHAVIKGTALNNDGNRKVGYTAPSMEGQAEVMRAALHTAGVQVESISYVEAHGTATPLGDTIEAKALKLAYKTDKKGYCAIGSVKSNIGHLNTSAGMAGLTKAILALKNRIIPPTIHFQSLNPQIDFSDSPFYVVNQLLEWKNDEYPLRAGVSVFGLGGTNFHAILEEAPPIDMIDMMEGEGESQQAKSREYRFQLIPWSARTAPALERMTESLAAHFRKNHGLNLADAAYTLQTGRKTFNHRKLMLCSSPGMAVELLSPSPDTDNNVSTVNSGNGKIYSAVTEDVNRPVIFMFPGQGSQYVNMARGLYETEPVFREEMDRLFEMLTPIMGFDPKEILYPGPGNEPVNDGINQTDMAQPMLFVIQYALANLLMKWGIKPKTMMGHSIGEYTAACLSGVMSLADALRLVVLRGKLIGRMPGGGMVSVPLPEEEISPLLNENLALAAVNTTASCVVSGSHEAIDAFISQLKASGHETRLLHTSHAFHSAMMEPVLAEFEEAARQIALNKPEIPFISNITGKIISAEQAMDPHYWALHIRSTVRFSEGLTGLLADPANTFLEVGPGRTLSTFATQHKDRKDGHLIINLVRHPTEEIDDHVYLLNKIGQCWLYGTAIDWQGFHGSPAPRERRRLPLPTYPFEKQRFWQDNGFDLREGFLGKNLMGMKKKDITELYYIPSWKHIPLVAEDSLADMPDRACWVLFSDDWGLGEQLKEQLEAHQQHVIVVKKGETFARLDDRLYSLNPHLNQKSDYETLFRDLQRKGLIPARLVHLWQIAPLPEDRNPLDLETINRQQDLGYYSLIDMARAVELYFSKDTLHLYLITNSMHRVQGNDDLAPGKITAMGPLRVIPCEYFNIKCSCIDVVLPKAAADSRGNLPEQLFEELISGETGQVVALRSQQRWIQYYEPLRLEKPGRGLRFKKDGVYLVIGGLGGIGLKLAEYIVKTTSAARLVLLGRSEFLPREEWEAYLSRDSAGRDEGMAIKIRNLLELEKSGARLLVLSADISQEEQMQRAIDRALAEFGTINGVIHSAGLADGEMIQKRERHSSEILFTGKITGTLVLDNVLQKVKPEFCVYCSSLGAILGVMGQVGYFAANAFLDAFAQYKNGVSDTFTLSINWDRWQSTGIANIIEGLHKEMTGVELTGGLSGEEGQEAFGRIMDLKLSQVAVTGADLMFMLEQSNQIGVMDIADSIEETPASGAKKQFYNRPNLRVEYAPPRDEIEKKLAEIWSNMFFIDKVGINDDFFELGGDSLKAITVISKIHKKLDVELPLPRLFNNPTIKEIAQYINTTYKNVFSSVVPAERKEYYPLSPGQKRLYVIQQLEPESTAYNMNFIIPLVEIHREKVETALQTLIRRHESARTSILVVEKEPVQRIHASLDFSLETYELGNDKGNEKNKAGVKEIIRRFIRPFDLSRAPFIRMGLIKTGEGFLLLIDTHHIIMDRFSQGIVIDEFLTIYRGLELPAPKLQYKDYTQWLAGEEKQVDLNRQKEYWLEQFSGDIPLLNLPLDFPRPEIQSFAGRYVSLSIDIAEMQQLRALALEEGVTLNTVLLTLFYILLWKISADEDIIIGCPMLGRTHADLERLIGMFVNTIAFRNFPEGEKSFLEFLLEVNERMLEALGHQEYSFDELVEQVLTHRDPSRNPLYDVMFVYNPLIEDPHLDAGDLLKISAAGNERSSIDNPGDMDSQNDLTLNINEYKDRFVYFISYCKKLFKEETIRRYLDHLHEIQRIIIANKHIKLKDVTISHDLVSTDSDILEEELEDFGF